MNHDELAGDEPLTGGMYIVVPLRRDLTVAGAAGAIFDGVLGHAAGRVLDARADHGPEPGGWRAR